MGGERDFELQKGVYLLEYNYPPPPPLYNHFSRQNLFRVLFAELGEINDFQEKTKFLLVTYLLLVE